MNKIEKPWGSEELIEHNERYVLKKLVMKHEQRCSLQYHEYKKETIYVLEGKLRITMGTDKDHLFDRVYSAGEHITIWPGMIHRMYGEEGGAVYLEASTSELDDVVRLEDDYKRV